MDWMAYPLLGCGSEADRTPPLARLLLGLLDACFALHLATDRTANAQARTRLPRLLLGQKMSLEGTSLPASSSNKRCI